MPLTHIPKYERLQEMSQRYPALDPGAVETCLALMAVAKEVSDGLNANLAGHGVSEGRFMVLMLLLEHAGRPLSHSELAELSGVTKGTITGLVDGLERDGYVKREESGADRRVTLIALTPAGHRHVEPLVPDHFGRLAALVSRLSGPERKTLLSLLAKVHAGLPATNGK